MANKNNLKVLRAKHNLTQKDVAAILDITRQQYSLKELGKAMFNQKEIETLIEFFGEKYEEIFFVEVANAS
ncbi:MAG: helix-turn-helix transcriptional regulator [Candidatus Odinarchaeota archaeon]